MQTFESGGALLVRPRPRWISAVAVLGMAMTFAAVPPLVGAYLLIVA